MDRRNKSNETREVIYTCSYNTSGHLISSYTIDRLYVTEVGIKCLLVWLQA